MAHIDGVRMLRNLSYANCFVISVELLVHLNALIHLAMDQHQVLGLLEIFTHDMFHALNLRESYHDVYSAIVRLYIVTYLIVIRSL